MGTLIAFIVAIRYWYVIAAVIALILLIIIVKKVRQSNARKRAAEAERLRQEEARKRIAQQEAEHEKMMAELRRKADELERRIQAAMAAVPGSEAYRLPQHQESVNVKTLEIQKFTPIAKKRFVAFDFETTGLNSVEDAIVEIGAVRVEDGRITATFSRLIDPERPMPADASAVNHITDSMLTGKPRIYEALPSFLAFVGDDVLVAHNAPFDCRFVLQACMRYRFRAPTVYFDTMDLAPVFFPSAPNKKLKTLLKAAGIENDEAHRALGDAKAVAELTIKTLCRPSKERNHETVDVTGNALSGLRFVLTGDVPGHDRAEVERLILQNGGKVTGSISGLTDFLVVGEYADPKYISDKQKKALDMMRDGGKIKIIGFPALLDMANVKNNG